MINLDLNKIYEWPLPLKLVIILLAAAFILLLGFWMDIAPYQTKLKNLTQQEGDLKRQLKSILEKKETISGELSQLPQLNALLREWQKKISTKEELPAILDQILKFGQENQLKIVTFDPANETKEENYYKTPVSISLIGSYEQIANFISQLANMPKLIAINSFVLNNENAKDSISTNAPLVNSNDLLSAQLEIMIYRR